MCLDRAKRIYPNEDLCCYKTVLVKKWGGIERYVSPFRGKEYKLNRLESLKDRTDAEIVTRSNTWEGRGKQSCFGGSYHTFAYFQDAVEHLSRNRSTMAILECRIPKSSRYVYEGICLTGDFKGYASQKVKPIKEVARSRYEGETIVDVFDKTLVSTYLVDEMISRRVKYVSL